MLSARTSDAGTAGGPVRHRFHRAVPRGRRALTEIRGPLVLDGELVVMRAGVPSFAGLQGRIHRTRPAAVQDGAVAAPALYVAFDLLHTGDRSLLAEPYARRRELLEDLELERPHLRVPLWWGRRGGNARPTGRQVARALSCNLSAANMPSAGRAPGPVPAPPLVYGSLVLFALQSSVSTAVRKAVPEPDVHENGRHLGGGRRDAIHRPRRARGLRNAKALAGLNGALTFRPEDTETGKSGGLSRRP
ncbi:hypothetical protein ACFU7Y_18430 [Kitasatospora sp. NPDC057542]|uniref:ATP-dependent DNA ligase n=1 Tax=Kitasatospora sp. NPDC057542 TaxID=3346162 RepID=UPI00369B4D28